MGFVGIHPGCETCGGIPYIGGTAGFVGNGLVAKGFIGNGFVANGLIGNGFMGKKLLGPNGEFIDMNGL